MPSSRAPLRPEDYKVACLCPFYLKDALLAMLDKTYPPFIGRGGNNYALGRMGRHNIVITTTPETGTISAVSVVLQLLKDFKSIKFGLSVGIGSGMPGEADDIRLGDIVVGVSRGIHGGAVQFDKRKLHSGERFERTGTTNKPPMVLLDAVNRLRSLHLLEVPNISQIMQEMLIRFPRTRDSGCFHPGVVEDRLFRPGYKHQIGGTCSGCNAAYLVKRTPRPNTDPQIHYGTIGSSSHTIHDGRARDALKQEFGLLCVDKDAAALMNEFPCLAIRGISDYADSHKNNLWQRYSAAVAAAYVKKLLSLI
ncbi:nucleoside phosphorylase domain-containing protein [Aspergillus californicus]